MNHSEAYLLAHSAYLTVLGNEPTGCEVAVIAAIAWLESNYGAGWKGEGEGSFNMGAITAGSSWTGPVFTATDSRPNNDGSSTQYETKFRVYSSALEGFKDLVRVAFVQANRSTVRLAAFNCNIDEVSTQLYDTGYYQGFGKTREERIAGHQKAMRNALVVAGQATLFPKVVAPSSPSQSSLLPGVSSGGQYGALKVGAKGIHVEFWQYVVGVKIDGVFGAKTRTATMSWQRSHNINPSGQVELQTWLAAFPGLP